MLASLFAYVLAGSFHHAHSPVAGADGVAALAQLCRAGVPGAGREACTNNTTDENTRQTLISTIRREMCASVCFGTDGIMQAPLGLDLLHSRKLMCGWLVARGPHLAKHAA